MSKRHDSCWHHRHHHLALPCYQHDERWTFTRKKNKEKRHRVITHTHTHTDTLAQTNSSDPHCASAFELRRFIGKLISTSVHPEQNPILWVELDIQANSSEKNLGIITLHKAGREPDLGRGQFEVFVHNSMTANVLDKWQPLWETGMYQTNTQP